MQKKKEPLPYLGNSFLAWEEDDNIVIVDLSMVVAIRERNYLTGRGLTLITSAGSFIYYTKGHYDILDIMNRWAAARKKTGSGPPP